MKVTNAGIGRFMGVLNAGCSVSVAVHICVSLMGGDVAAARFLAVLLAIYLLNAWFFLSYRGVGSLVFERVACFLWLPSFVLTFGSRMLGRKLGVDVTNTAFFGLDSGYLLLESLCNLNAWCLLLTHWGREEQPEGRSESDG